MRSEDKKHPYAKLIEAGGMLRRHGDFLKVLGVVGAIAGLLMLFFGFVQFSQGFGEMWGALLLMAGLGTTCSSLGLMALGVLLSGAGEAGHALADIAVNTAQGAQRPPAPAPQAAEERGVDWEQKTSNWAPTSFPSADGWQAHDRAGAGCACTGCGRTFEDLSGGNFCDQCGAKVLQEGAIE